MKILHGIVGRVEHPHIMTIKRQMDEVHLGLGSDEALSSERRSLETLRQSEPIITLVRVILYHNVYMAQTTRNNSM
jgi:hypothetical protein